MYDLLKATGSIHEVIMSHHFCVELATFWSFKPASISTNKQHLKDWKADLQDRGYSARTGWAEHKYSLV